jgi:hypothetical protein
MMRCLHRKAAASVRARCAVAALPILFMPAVLHGETWLPPFAVTSEPAPINSIGFAVRGALPGQPDYLQTVKYIDDGMRFADPGSRFFISPAGEMCFRIRPHYPTVYYDDYYRNWCMHPWTVDRVEAGIGFAFNEVRLWCAHSAPQCAHSVDEIANGISAPTTEYRQERWALQNLIYLMGGSVSSSRPLE